MAEAERVAKTKFTACTLEMTVLAQRDRLIGYYEHRGFHRTGETRPFPADPVFARPLRRPSPVLTSWLPQPVHGHRSFAVNGLTTVL